MFLRNGRRHADFGGSGFQSMSISEVRVCVGLGNVVMLTNCGQVYGEFREFALSLFFAWQRKGN